MHVKGQLCISSSLGATAIAVLTMSAVSRHRPKYATPENFFGLDGHATWFVVVQNKLPTWDEHHISLPSIGALKFCLNDVPLNRDRGGSRLLNVHLGPVYDSLILPIK